MPFGGFNFSASFYPVTAPKKHFLVVFFSFFKFVPLKTLLNIVLGTSNQVCAFSRDCRCAFWESRPFSLIEPFQPILSISSILMIVIYHENQAEKASLCDAFFFYFTLSRQVSIRRHFLHFVNSKQLEIVWYSRVGANYQPTQLRIVSRSPNHSLCFSILSTWHFYCLLILSLSLEFGKKSRGKKKPRPKRRQRRRRINSRYLLKTRAKREKARQRLLLQPLPFPPTPTNVYLINLREVFHRFSI